MEDKEMIPQHIYTVDKNNNDGYVLVKDNIISSCLKLPPIPISHSPLGGIQYSRMSCCTNCPKANVFANEAGQMVYRVSCEGTHNDFVVTPSKPASESLILKK